MDQVYQFIDWTSASRMKNILNPCLTIDIGIVRGLTITTQGTEIETILGYQLAVIDNSVNRVLYKFYIDYGEEGTWSLSTNEAIEMLNQIGFPCEFNTETFNINDEVRAILTNLKGLGYTHISRSIRPPEVLVYDPALKIPRALSLITKYNYHDFWNISNVPTSIDSILGNS